MEDDDEDEDNMDGKEERKSLKQSLDTLQNTLLEFQEGCGLVASYLERISNMAHFEEVPKQLLFFIFLMFEGFSDRTFLLCSNSRLPCTRDSWTQV